MSRRNAATQERGITISNSSEELSIHTRGNMADQNEDDVTAVGLDDDDSLAAISSAPAVRWNEEQHWQEANKGTSSILPFVNAFFLTVATVLVRCNNHTGLTQAFNPKIFKFSQEKDICFLRNLHLTVQFLLLCRERESSAFR